MHALTGLPLPLERDRGWNQLRYPLAPADREGLVAEIDHDDLQFAAVITVDRARGVGDGDAVLQRQAGTRTHLYLVAFGNGDLQAGGYRVPLAGHEVEVLGAVMGLPERERGFRVRLATGKEITLVREAGHHWYADERID